MIGALSVCRELYENQGKSVFLNGQSCDSWKAMLLTGQTSPCKGLLVLFLTKEGSS